MPNLRAITTIINNNLKSNVFNTRRFQGGKYFDLAYLISNTDEADKKTVSAMQVDNNGEGIDVTINDIAPIQIYHRNTALAYEDDEKETFGDPANETKEIADMILICIGDRKKLKVNQEDVAAAIMLFFIRNLTAAELASFGLEKVVIDSFEVNVRPEEVWNQEYENVAYALTPEQFMLSIKYKITSIYSKCFQLCN